MKIILFNNLSARATLLAIGLLSGIQAYAQNAVTQWMLQYNGRVESDDRTHKLALDSAGDVVVVGSSQAGMKGSEWLILKYSRSGVPLWTNFYAGPDDSVGSANDVVVDGSDNVLVTGYSSQRDFNYLLIKYSGTGVPLWTNCYIGPRNYWGDTTNAVAVDASGNVFMTAGAATLAYSSAGVPLWTNLYPAAEATGLASDRSGNLFVTGRAGDYDDYVTIKYSQTGVALWTNRYIVCGYGHTYSAAVDGSGNVFVSGSTDCNASATVAYSSGGVPLWTNQFGEPGKPAVSGLTIDGIGNVLSTGSSSGEYLTVAFSNAGVPLWTSRYHGPGNGLDGATALAVDSSGNVYVTGASRGSVGYYDYATIKYSGIGEPLWTNRYSGSGDSLASSLTVDAGGNVFVTGSSWSGGSFDAVTLAYSSTGTTLWTNRFNRSGDSDDQPRAVTVDHNGNVFVTGTSSGSGISAYASFGYSGAGTPLWTNRFTTPGNGIGAATAIAVDSSGNVVVTGSSSFPTNVFSSSDYATILYSKTGVPLWTNRYNGPGSDNDEATAVAVDANGNVFVTGRSVGTNGANVAYATLKYSSTGLPLWTNRYSGPRKIADEAVALALDSGGLLGDAAIAAKKEPECLARLGSKPYVRIASSPTNSQYHFQAG